MSNQPGMNERVARLEERSKTVFARLGRIEAIQWAMIVGVGGSQFAIILKLWSV